MSIHNNIFSLSSPSNENTNSFNLQSFINRLLLFDKFILYSPNFKEIPYLAKIFGFEDTLKILSSGALKISNEHRIVAQVAQNSFLSPDKKSLPIGNYSISYGYSGKERQVISDSLERMGRCNLNNNQFKKLKLAVVQAIEDKYLQNTNTELMQQTSQDIASNRYIKSAVVIAVENHKNLKIKQEDFEIKLHQIGENNFKAETNLDRVLSLDEIEIHKIIEKSVLGIAGINKRIAEMKLHQALSGFLDNEATLLGDKLEFFLQDYSLQKLEKNFNRIINLRQLPMIVSDSDYKINVDKLLDIRNSRELKEFREYLNNLDTMSDHEILDQINNIRSKLGIKAYSPQGKIARLSLSTLISTIPVISTLAGLGIGILDHFILEKVLPYSGVVAFTEKQYPSIFEN